MHNPDEKAVAQAASAAEKARPRPQSLGDLFMSMTLLALQGFGGVLAVVQRELVEKKGWLTREEFLEEWAVAQVMPGPNVINLSLMLGHRYFGLAGAMVAVCGMLALPLLVVLGLGLLYAQHANQPQVISALRGMGAVAAGLVMATGLKLVSTLRRHPLGLPLSLTFTAITFVLVALVRVPLLLVLLAVGGIACVLTWRRIAP